MPSVASGLAGVLTITPVTLFTFFFFFTDAGAVRGETKDQRPTAAQTAEIRRLEKDLYDQQDRRD